MGAQGPDELLQATLCAQRAGLLSASRGQGAKSWLRSSMRSEDGTEALLQQLQQHILEDSFLLQLRHNAEHPTPPIPGAGELASHEVLSSDWWSISDVENKELASPEQDSYVMVEHSDALEALGAFVAAYLSSLPEAKNLQPAELQAALNLTLKEMRQSRLQKLWQWGRTFYRCAAVSYSAFSLYTNPWIARAVLASLWTASRIIAGFT